MKDTKMIDSLLYNMWYNYDITTLHIFMVDENKIRPNFSYDVPRGTSEYQSNLKMKNINSEIQYIMGYANSIGIMDISLQKIPEKSIWKRIFEYNGKKGFRYIWKDGSMTYSGEDE